MGGYCGGYEEGTGTTNATAVRINTRKLDSRVMIDFLVLILEHKVGVEMVGRTPVH